MEANEFDQLKIGTEPQKLRAISDLYVKYTKFGYAVALDVIELKSKRNFYIFVTAASLSKPIYQMRIDNEGSIQGCEFWVWKKDETKTSAYVVEE